MMDIPIFNRGTVEGVSRVIGELYTGSRLTGILSEAKLNHHDPGPPVTKWARVAESIEKQQHKQGDGRPLIRVVTEAFDPRNLLTSTTGYSMAEARDEINTILSFDGFKVREDGKVGIVAKARTVDEARQRSDQLRHFLAERGAHAEVLKYCRPDLLVDDYYEATFESIKGLAARLKSISGLDLDGSKLLQKVFGGKQPIIQLNEGETETQRNEQRGVQLLGEGVFAAFRNPASHEPRLVWNLSQQDALDIMGVISLIHRRVDTAQLRNDYQ